MLTTSLLNEVELYPSYHLFVSNLPCVTSVLAVCRQAAVLEHRLDEKERGIADKLVALVAGALTAAWKLEATPRRPHRLLRVSSRKYIFVRSWFLYEYLLTNGLAHRCSSSMPKPSVWSNGSYVH